MLCLEHIASYIPPGRIDIEKAPEKFNLTSIQAKVFSKIYRLKTVPIADESSVAALIERPVVKLLSETRVSKEQIRLIIHTHTGRVVAPFGDSSVRRIRDKLGLWNATAFGISLNNCASTLTAFEVAGMMLGDLEDGAKAIVVTGDLTFTPTLRAIANVSILGDATAAALISLKGNVNSVQGIFIKNYGEFSPGTWMSHELSVKFEEEYVDMVVDTINIAISDHGLKKDAIKMILPHNVNYISWVKIMKALDMPSERVFLDNVEKYGHCFGSDIMINYVTAMEMGRIKKGDYYLMVTVGLGATVAVAIIQH